MRLRICWALVIVFPITYPSMAAAMDVTVVGEEARPVEGALPSMKGVLVDQDGQPVVGAALAFCEIRGDNWQYLQPPASNDEGRIAHGGLEPGLRYQLIVRAKGCDTYTTDEWTAKAGMVHDLGTIELRRHHGSIAGAVTDTNGDPVGGVTVLNVLDAPRRLATETDAEGRFRLEGLHEGSAIVFVRSPEHRFAGVPVAVGSEGLTIVIEPKRPGTMGEPPAPREPVWSDEGMAQRLAAMLRWALDGMKEAKGSSMRRLLLGTLARVDPNLAYQEAAEGGDSTSEITRKLGVQLLDDDPDEAMALLRQTTNPHRLALTLYIQAEKRVASNPELARACLDESLIAAEAIEDVERRVWTVAVIGDDMCELDEERSMEILAEARTAAEGLGITGGHSYARGVVAACLCERDLAGALALVEPIEDEDARSRHLTNIARRIAPTAPDRALELIEGVTEELTREWALATVLPFLPKGRLGEAVGTARGLDDHFHRALALCRLASVVSMDQRAGLLEEAMAALVEGARGNASDWKHFAEGAARVTLVARRLGYQEWPEFMWTTAAMLHRGETPYPDARYAVIDELDIAATLALADPEFGRHMVESALTHAGGLDEVLPGVYRSLGIAAARVDLQWAIELVRQMKPDDAGDGPWYRAHAVDYAARQALEGADRLEDEALQYHYQCSWVPIDQDY